MQPKIVQKGAEVLRQRAQEVPIEEIGSPRVARIIKDMKGALHAEDDGVAIAAPQIGESVRIFVVSGKVLSPNYPDLQPDERIPDDLVFVNPVMVKLSKQKKSVPEGCLSVRWLYGNVMRSTRATVRAYDEHGREFERGGSGLMAQIFQHEYDHLDGKLFVDTATDLEDLPPERKHHHHRHAE